MRAATSSVGVFKNNSSAGRCGCVSCVAPCVEEEEEEEEGSSCLLSNLGVFSDSESGCSGALCAPHMSHFKYKAGFTNVQHEQGQGSPSFIGIFSHFLSVLVRVPLPAVICLRCCGWMASRFLLTNAAGSVLSLSALVSNPPYLAPSLTCPELGPDWQLVPSSTLPEGEEVLAKGFCLKSAPDRWRCRLDSVPEGGGGRASSGSERCDVVMRAASRQE